MNKNNAQPLHYRFVKQYEVPYGYAVYLSGELKQLGCWDPLKAIKMECKHKKFWVSQVEVPLGVYFQFKYFVAPYELDVSILSKISWIGSTNQHLSIPYSHFKKFSQKNDKELNIMSFNLRYENKQDKGSYSWLSRRDNCCSLILQHFPDVIGVQEPKKNQVQYIISQIGAFYNYFGRPRDLNSDQSSGIFIRKDKFLVLQDKYVWINQAKIPAKTGFGACLPRYFTYLVVQPLNSKNQLFMAINTHLDHEKTLARAQGIKFIAQSIQQQHQKYGKKLNNFFLTGDFNTLDTDPIFKELKLDQSNLQSLRHMLPKEKSDFDQTFNGFRPKILSFVNKIIKIADVVIIDHIFTKCKDYEPVKFEVVRIENMIISDHYPIVGYFAAISSQNA